MDASLERHHTCPVWIKGCVCVRLCLWTKFMPNQSIDLDAVFAKWLLTILARILLNLLTLGQRSRSQWRNTLFFIILCLRPCFVSQLSYVQSKWNSVCRLDKLLVDLCLDFIKNWMGDDIIVTSLKVSPNNCPYPKFYWPFKLRTWNQYTTT